jgi:hypothetical protein
MAADPDEVTAEQRRAIDAGKAVQAWLDKTLTESGPKLPPFMVGWALLQIAMDKLLETGLPADEIKTAVMEGVGDYLDFKGARSRMN